MSISSRRASCLSFLSRGFALTALAALALPCLALPGAMAEESSGQWAGLWRDAAWSAHEPEGYTAQSAASASADMAASED